MKDYLLLHKYILALLHILKEVVYKRRIINFFKSNFTLGKIQK